MSRIMIILFAGLAIFTADTFALALNTPIECNRENEEYQCGSACQTTCTNLGQNCSIINIRCNDACYCKPGYARMGGDSSPCIPIENCPIYYPRGTIPPNA
ncbi:inducible metalloproteinase inhibitor protein [Solenopsis invicta]|uniref:inducible metalloproteinase inhibitor protein n=1 Tax=Solenopsis invicta TaxID=13686 RepID=UPI0001FECCA4|nr:inducible metalloproteinase inhibitor protein [Solenopsis invicta]XP_011166054.1 inducible metalloproteinase inhibitor protein [Solenopsis invicta]